MNTNTVENSSSDRVSGNAEAGHTSVAAPLPHETPEACAAFRVYVELGPKRRFGRVANKVGVSVRTVSRWAAKSPLFSTRPAAGALPPSNPPNYDAKKAAKTDKSGQKRTERRCACEASNVETHAHLTIQRSTLLPDATIQPCNHSTGASHLIGTRLKNLLDRCPYVYSPAF